MALAVSLFLIGTGDIRAERFLTVTEAQRICFPAADQFEPQTIRFTPEQVKAIERQCGTAIRTQGNRIWHVRQNGKLQGVIFLDHVLGKHEIIDYVVAITPAGKVAQVEILAYRESYGGDIRGEKWRAQFKGKDATAPLRLNDDIYNISGATLSCRHVTEGIKRVLATFEHVVRPALSGADGLPKPKSAHRS